MPAPILYNVDVRYVYNVHFVHKFLHLFHKPHTPNAKLSFGSAVRPCCLPVVPCKPSNQPNRQRDQPHRREVERVAVGRVAKRMRDKLPARDKKIGYVKKHRAND